MNDDAEGAEQYGERPVVILQTDKFNKMVGILTVIIVPISTYRPQKEGRFTEVILSKGEGGLKNDSVAICHQVRALDKGRFKNKIGRLPEIKMNTIEQKLAIIMGFK